MMLTNCLLRMVKKGYREELIVEFPKAPKSRLKLPLLMILDGQGNCIPMPAKIPSKHHNALRLSLPSGCVLSIDVAMNCSGSVFC
jgi:hypothetical protein